MHIIRERSRRNDPNTALFPSAHTNICSIAFLSLLPLVTMAAVAQNFITVAPGFIKGCDWKSDVFGRRRHKPRVAPSAASQRHCIVRSSSSSSSPSDHDVREDPISTTQEEERIRRWSGENIAKIAVAVFAAGVVIVGPGADAMAAKTGGRVGGQAFRSAPPPRSAPRINNSRTNIFINPPVAPPIFGGYGFGTPFFGGWSWSPFSFFVPGPSVAIGVGGGFEIFGLLLVLAFVGSIIRSFLRRNDDDDEYYD